jgi:phenylpyruvate tautomerase PptA (4-oxalocrotonate tautomerase family)
MSMIDASVPQNALTAEAERRLLEEVTEILVQHEGFDPTRQRPRDATWILVQRPEVFVAGNHPGVRRSRDRASADDRRRTPRRQSRVDLRAPAERDDRQGLRHPMRPSGEVERILLAWPGQAIDVNSEARLA